MGVIGSGDGDYIGKRVKNNITYVSMTTKYPIIKHIGHFQNFTFFYFPK